MSHQATVAGPCFMEIQGALKQDGGNHSRTWYGYRTKGAAQSARSQTAPFSYKFDMAGPLQSCRCFSLTYKEPDLVLLAAQKWKVQGLHTWCP